MSKPLPYGRQSVTEDDIEAVVRTLKGEWLTSGPAVTEFQQVVRTRLGVKHAIAVCNGTAALHLCCLALGISPGDVVVSSPLTFLASGNCAAYCGGRPDFVDIRPETYCLSPNRREDYITRNGPPRGVIPVDYAGVPAELEAVHELGKKYGFAVVEDAAHAIGSQYLAGGRWYECGSCVHSDMAIFSFHPVKTVTAGEGGMVLTNDDALAAKARMFASHGMERDVRLFQPWSIANESGELTPAAVAASGNTKAPWLYQQQVLGFNYRITDIQSALGVSQFARLDETIALRRAIFDRYQELFAGNEALLRPPCPEGTRPAYHLYVLRFKNMMGSRRVDVCSRLREEGIFAQVHYIPVYLQPWYQQHYGYARGKCPEAEAVYENSLSIPLFPAMTEEDIQRVVSIVSELAG